jgi:HlyD family secretion protein
MNSNPNEKAMASSPKRNQARRHVRRWLPYAGAAVLLFLLIAGLWPGPIPVETARVTQGALRTTVNEEGKTRLKQRYVISAPVTGQLRRIPFKAGAAVQAGQTVLAVIDPVTPVLLDARARALAEARRDAASANLEKARVSHDFALSELRRSEKLYKEQTVTIQELETAQWREASAAKEKVAAESALRQAEAELAEFVPVRSSDTNSASGPTELKAPITGQVLRVVEENARVVTSGTPLLEIGDATDLEVVVEVLTRDGAVISPGAKVELEQWGGGEPLAGQVRLVEPSAFTKVSALGVEEQRVKVIVDLLTPPDQRRSVGDQFRVEARIVIWETSQALKVPTGALFRRGQDWAAFVVVNGRAQLRLVKAGRSNGIEIEVVEGLQQGDEVILYPGARVKPGHRVQSITI